MTNGELKDKELKDKELNGSASSPQD